MKHAMFQLREHMSDKIRRMTAFRPAGSESVLNVQNMSRSETPIFKATIFPYTLDAYRDVRVHVHVHVHIKNTCLLTPLYTCTQKHTNTCTYMHKDNMQITTICL